MTHSNVEVPPRPTPRHSNDDVSTMTLSLLWRRSCRLTTTPLLASSQSTSIRWFSEKPEKRKTNVKKKKKGKQKDAAGKDRYLDLILRSLDAPISSPPKPSPEVAQENYEIGRNYVIGMFERHNALQHDLACKLKLKDFAIKMLPKNTRLKEEALKIDKSVPPLWRPIPNDTPPIPDFDPSQFIHRDDD